MFEHILVPTDGSDLSYKAAGKAVELAKLSGGHITALHVAPAYRSKLQEEHMPSHFMFRDDYERHVQEQAQPHLDAIRKLSTAAGIPCEAHCATNDSPAEAIVKAAKHYDCDAIVMGSHGRKGFSRLLLGSQTQKVLVSTEVPVLVTH